MANENLLRALQDKATRLRIHSIQATTEAGSGHPTSCCSAADIVAALFFKVMCYDPKKPENPNNDRFVLSKGHAAPLLYAAWAEAGNFPVEDLLTLRRSDSIYEGHPTPRIPFVDVATGSLGQGLSAGVGMALNGKYLEESDYRVYVMLGDGESAEGSVWEAAEVATHYKLDNLIAIIDINRLGQSQETMLEHDLDTYKKRWGAFGWRTLVIDGHDMEAVLSALGKARRTKDQPTVILAKTLKGKGVQALEDEDGWHGKPLKGEVADSAIAELTARLNGADPVRARKPKRAKPTEPKPITMAPPSYSLGDKAATREAYGTALTKLGEADSRIVALDGDTKNSTFAHKFATAYPNRFFECFIAEQNLVGAAVGLATYGKIPFASTFAAFFSRAYDQIRMAGITRANIKMAGSHVGVSIGEDGPSQMALEDLAMFRAIPECVVLYPSDAVSTEKAVELAANYQGMAFIRTSRPKTPVIYENNEPFEIGKAKVLRQSPNDKVTIVGGGITVFEALEAHDKLKSEGISVRVIDVFSVKPVDGDTLLKSARATNNLMITVEDHYPEGGLGDAVLDAVGTEGIRVHKMAVREIPRSGEPAELVEIFGISAKAIVEKVRSLV